MLGTNSQIEVLLLQLEDEIGRLERLIRREGVVAGRSELLKEMWARRRTLRQLMARRRIEAAKPVVDFQKWRDGGGAIQLFTAQLERHAELSA